jgi:hypothetical protein
MLGDARRADAEEGTMGSGDILRGLVGRELAARSEPWARKLVDPATGQAHPDVVAVLARVAAGLERGEEADALSEPPSREALVAWLVDTLIVDPDDPKTAQRPQLQTAVRVQFDDRDAEQLSPRALDALAELILGAREQSHPRALRVAFPERVVDEYLRGGDASPRPAVLFDATETIEVEAIPLSAHRVPRTKTPARQATGRGGAAKRRPAAPAKAGVKKKRKPAAKKAVARARPRRAAKASARKRTPVRARSAKKHLVRKKVRAGTRRPAAKHARRKKK